MNFIVTNIQPLPQLILLITLLGKYIDSHGNLKPALEPIDVVCHCKCVNNFSADGRKAICASYSKLDYNQKKISFCAEWKWSKWSGVAITLSILDRLCLNILWMLNLEIWRYASSSFVPLWAWPVAGSCARRERDAGLRETSWRAIIGGDILHPPANKTSAEMEESARIHICSFPVMDPHYCRRDSLRQYLPPGLSKTKMSDLYVEWVRSSNIDKPISNEIYTKILNRELQLWLLFIQEGTVYCLY